MSELSKEELIEKLKIEKQLYENPTDDFETGYIDGVNSSIRVIKQLPDTPKKQLVPPYIDKFIKNYSDPIFEICNYADYYGDCEIDDKENHIREVLEWFKYHKKEFYNAVVNGYEVEQPKRWVVVKNEEYFIEFKNQVTDGIPYHSLTGANKDYAHLFTDKRKADLVAELIGGTVEEV